jgi:hypothetical protein
MQINVLFITKIIVLAFCEILNLLLGGPFYPVSLRTGPDCHFLFACKWSKKRQECESK